VTVEAPPPFFNLPASDFPFVVEFFQEGLPEGSDPLSRIVVDGPGAVICPGYGALGIRVLTRITYPDGRVEEQGPPDV